MNGIMTAAYRLLAAMSAALAMQIPPAPRVCMTAPARLVSMTDISFENLLSVIPESVLTKKERGARMTVCSSCLCNCAELLGTVTTSMTQIWMKTATALQTPNSIEIPIQRPRVCLECPPTADSDHHFTQTSGNFIVNENRIPVTMTMEQ